MVQYSGTVLDASFAALSDATRRGVLEQLGRADASITDLAEKFHMTLTGMKKHVGVLEEAGLVATEKVGRVRTCKLGRRGLAAEAAWIERQRQLWAARFNELDELVEELNKRRKPMYETNDSESNATKYATTVERKSERELVVTRTFNGPAHIVFDAWTKPELLQRWWIPKSCGVSFLSCEADARTGGKYRFVFSHASSDQPVAFFGRYVEVIPNSRLVWTNDESDEGGAVTTVTFEEKGDETLVTMHDLYPSTKALDDGIASGSTSGSGESFEQLDQLLVNLQASMGRP